MTFNPNTLSLYPSRPGVYLMKDAQGVVLYIGKAKNLKLRLKQYFGLSKDTRAMIPYLIAKVDTIDTIVALTEKDALILENTLIKQHKPKYNILLKDDKTYVSLMLTKHQWPLLKLTRYKGKPKEDGTYFGPYTSSFAAKQTLDLLLRMFPIRQCSDAELQNRVRPCLLYDIKRCIAPCVHLCTQEQYDQHVEAITELLKGKNKDFIQALEKKMELASENLEFEKAADFLQLIKQVKHVMETQTVEYPEGKDCDVLGIYREADATVIVCLMFREGKLIGSEPFRFHFIASSDQEVICSFLLQHYQAGKSIPQEILLPHPLQEAQEITEILSETAGHFVKLLYPQKGRRRDLLKMGYENAKALFAREHDVTFSKEKMLLDLAETLQLTHFPRRIECFDTSNISGTDPVASLTCFIDGEKDKSRMKLFKIKTQETADDYTAMKEVLRRHFTKAKEKNDFCDLLIVDGGKGQLGLAMEIFQELQIASIDVIGLAKEEARHDKGLSQEKIYVPYRKDPIYMDRKSPLLFFLQKVRDEAHRLAVSYHRKRRAKRTISSDLDQIKGIGPTKKNRLLRRFQSIKNLQAANDDEILQVEGITKRDVDAIRDFFSKKSDDKPT